MNGLDCYYKGILCEIEGTEIVNTSHALQSSIITFWLLHIFAFESVLQSLFEYFASIHLLVFGSPFIVSPRLGGWVVSKRLANKSAWSSSSAGLTVLLVNPTSCLQRYNTFQRLLSQKTLLLKTEIRRLWSPSEKLTRNLHSCQIEDLTKTLSIWRHSVNSPQIPHARSRTIWNSVLTGRRNSRIQPNQKCFAPSYCTK